MSMFDKYELSIYDHDSKSIDSKRGDYILSQMLDYWKDPKDIKEEVIPEIDKVLNGEISVSHDIGADVVGSADVYPDITHLGWSEVGYKDMTLPTEDFKQLWLEWIDILEMYKKHRQTSKKES